MVQNDKKTAKRQSKRKSNHINLNDSIDLDFEKTESDIFENDEDIEELLERQEEIIEQARCLRLVFKLMCRARHLIG